MKTTFAAVAERTGIAIPTHLEAQATVPHAKLFWRQGDLYIRRSAHKPPTNAPAHSLSGHGHSVVKGEADRNSHVLNGDGTFFECTPINRLTDYGLLVVPEGGEAILTHTAEHGSVALGAVVPRGRATTGG
jgi:hypothetical protein